MFEESTTPDLVELVRRADEAVNGHDFDAMMSLWGPDPVWDLSPMGLGLYEGAVAVRRLIEDWQASYEHFEIKTEEALDLGHGIAFTVASEVGRPRGSSGEVAIRYASVVVWKDGLIVRATSYGDIDEGRAAAERLAESRG